MSTVSPIHSVQIEGTRPETENNRKLAQLEKRILRLELLVEEREVERRERCLDHGITKSEPTRFSDHPHEVLESLALRLNSEGIHGVTLPNGVNSPS